MCGRAVVGGVVCVCACTKTGWSTGFSEIASACVGNCRRLQEAAPPTVRGQPTSANEEPDGVVLKTCLYLHTFMWMLLGPVWPLGVRTVARDVPGLDVAACSP